MLAYLKLKTNDEELYETNYLEELKQKQTKFSKLQYTVCKYYYNFIAKLKYHMNIITVKQIYDAYLFILPFSDLSKDTKLEKCVKKVKILMQRYNIQSLVAEDNLKQSEKFKKIIEPETKKIHILDGRGIMPYLIQETLENILKRQGSKTELEDLYICVKENKPLHIENIIYLMKYFKNINIVTPNIKEFQRVADKIEENENIIITVTNNKKKSLKKAKVIVNFDLLENEINKYIIYREAVILTIDEKGFYESNTFNGIQIRRIGIDASNEIKDFFEQYNLLDDNELSALYESRINQKQGLSQIKQQMKKDEIKVTKLYGKNGSL